MRLVLRLSEGGANPRGVPREMAVENGRLTIGRGAECDWVLPDPEAILSKQHCVIDVGADRCRLTDTSTNGVFLNAAAQPLGRNNGAELRHGDRLALGRYELIVEVEEGAGASGERGAPVLEPDDPFAPSAPLGGPALPDDEFSLGLGGPAAGQLIPDDPELFGGREARRPLVGSAPRAAEPDHLPSEHEQFDAPRVVRATPRQAAARPVREPARAERASPGGGVADAAARAFLEGLGTDEASLGRAVDAETLRRAGMLLRLLVAGLREVLLARTTIKNEMRVARTQIRLENNNPVKFAVTPEEALSLLLGPAKSGYLPAERAVEEAFRDVTAHQVATMAGLQGALAALLEDFAPENLKNRIEKEPILGNLMPAARKARYWDMYESLFGKIASEAAEVFGGRFAQEFARAYEEQVRKLR